MRALSVVACLVLVACSGSGGKGPASSSSAAAARGSAVTASAGGTPTAVSASTAPEEPAPPSDIPATIEGANLTMNDGEIDGFKLTKVECKAPGANPFAAMAMLAPFAKARAALDACVDSATEVQVHVRVVGNEAQDLAIAGVPNAGAARCIAKAVASAAWANDFTCNITLRLKADAAAPK